MILRPGDGCFAVYYEYGEEGHFEIVGVYKKYEDAYERALSIARRWKNMEIPKEFINETDEYLLENWGMLTENEQICIEATVFEDHKVLMLKKAKEKERRLAENDE